MQGEFEQAHLCRLVGSLEISGADVARMVADSAPARLRGSLPPRKAPVRRFQSTALRLPQVLLDRLTSCPIRLSAVMVAGDSAPGST